eukprot:2760861-Pyramimonas_sp.AAC.1
MAASVPLVWQRSNFMGWTVSSNGAPNYRAMSSQLIGGMYRRPKKIWTPFFGLVNAVNDAQCKASR